MLKCFSGCCINLYSEDDPLLNKFIILVCGCYWQERAAALADSRPVPALSGSEDIRPLNMDDFKYAHERVIGDLKLYKFNLLSLFFWLVSYVEKFTKSGMR